MTDCKCLVNSDHETTIVTSKVFERTRPRETGVLTFRVNNRWDITFAPCWEDELETIRPTALNNTGGFEYLSAIPYPLNDWTMNLDKDVSRYIDTIVHFLRDNKKEIEEIYGKIS